MRLGQWMVWVRMVWIRVEGVVPVEEAMAMVRLISMWQGHNVGCVGSVGCVPWGEGLREAEVRWLLHGQREDMVVRLVRAKVVQGGPLGPRTAHLHPVHIALKVRGKVHDGWETQEALRVLEA